MHMLYNSDSFVVVQFKLPEEELASNTAPGAAPLLAGRGGFEIVDKHAGREIYLSGPVAESFQRGVEALVQAGPSEEQLDDYISGFVQLAQQPVVLH
jgi:hypothetical protein